MRLSLLLLTFILSLSLVGCEREADKHFDAIIYSRPDTRSLVEKINSVKEDADYPSLLKRLEEINGLYTKFSTMLTYLTVKSSADTSDVFLVSEYSLLSEEANLISDAMESLLVRLANSKHGARLETEIFGAGFVEKYAKERKNEHVSALLLKETQLENKYRELLPSVEGNAEKRRIFTELVRVRRQIADALGYVSYTERAYEVLEHNYSPRDMSAFSKAVADTVVPLAAELETKVFEDFFFEKERPNTDIEEVINTLENLFNGDKDLSTAYTFMKSNSLYDVAPLSQSRRAGAYTVYIEGLEAPFIFMSASETPTDYAVLAHEFGHFFDFLVNQGRRASMDLLEVSSQALELLTLDALESSIDEETYNYLYFSEMRDVIYNLIYQSFYSEFEHLAYSLELSEITEDRLTELVAEAAERMNLAGEYLDSLDFVLTDQVVLEPHYSQSYAVSLIPSLEIYFGEGDMKAYKDFIKRDEGCNFNVKICESSLSDVFDEATVNEISYKIKHAISEHYSRVQEAVSKELRQPLNLIRDRRIW